MASGVANPVQEGPSQISDLGISERTIAIAPFSHHWIAPSTIRRKDSAEHVRFRIVVIETGRIGVGKRLGDPQPDMPRAPSIIKPQIEEM